MASLAPLTLTAAVSALLVAFLLAGVAAFAWALLLVEERRRGRMLRRLEDPAALSDDNVGLALCLEGRLEGAALVSTFSGAACTAEEPHPRAATTVTERTDEEPPRLVVGGQSVALVGPLQVVLGAVERREHRADVTSVRRLANGQRVRAVGRLVRAPAAASGGYRDVAARYELHPPEADAAYPPIALYGVRGGTRTRASLLLGAGLACLGAAAAGTVQLVMHRPPSYVAAALPSPPRHVRPACAAEVDARLDRSDPWAARELATSAGCDDAQGRAEASWMLGEVDRAAEDFAVWRSLDPAHPYTAAEAEAAMLTDRARASELLGAMKTDWYRGPDDVGQATLGCLLDMMKEPTAYQPCAAGPARDLWRSLADEKNIEFLPGYALHDPTTYARFTLLEPVNRPPRLAADGPLAGARLQTELANVADRQMLHAAITGETDAYDEAAGIMDDTVSVVERLGRLRFDDLAVAAEGQHGSVRAAFDEERESIRYDAQRDLSVAASAAFFAHDAARVQRYLLVAEAHSGAILEEHLRLVAGTQAAPIDSHHPSDYSDVDMVLFAEVDSADPAAFARKLHDTAFTSPACLADFLTHRPRLHAAVRAQMNSGYLEIPILAPLYTILDAAFRRRFAAGLVGDAQLEARWLTVTRNIGAALRRDGALLPVVSLESLLTKE